MNRIIDIEEIFIYLNFTFLSFFCKNEWNC